LERPSQHSLATVDAVVVDGRRSFHVWETDSIHVYSRGGTLDFHSLYSLDTSISAHKRCVVALIIFPVHFLTHPDYPRTPKVERLASVKNAYIRIRGMYDSGGTETSAGLELTWREYQGLWGGYYGIT